MRFAARSYAALALVPAALAALLAWRLATGHRAAPRDDAPAVGGGPRAVRAAAVRGVLRIEPQLPVEVDRGSAIVVPGSPGVVEGQVVSAPSGEGLAAAALSFTSGGEVREAHADAEGRFRFVAPSAAAWKLAAVHAAGHVPYAPEWGRSPLLLDARPGAHVRRVRIALAPAAPLRVAVIGRRDAAVADAEVRVLGGGAGESAIVPLRERATTGADGTAAVLAPPGAVVVVTARGTSGRAQVDYAAMVTGQLTVRLGAEPLPADRPALAGRVELPSGEGAADAVVAAWPRWPAPGGTPSDALADRRGVFRVEGLSPGTYDVVARLPGLAPARALDVRAGNESIVLRLGPGGRVVGRAVAADDRRPASPCTVVARQRTSGHGDPVLAVASLDPAGRFELDGLPPGPAWLVAVAPGLAPSEPVAVEVPPPGSPPPVVELALPRGSIVRGVVRRRGTGEPVPGAEVTLETAPSEISAALPLRLRAVTGADGAFELRGVPPRATRIVAGARGHHARVTVLPAAGPEPVRGIEIELAPLAPGEGPQVETIGIGAALVRAGDLLYVEDVVPDGGAAKVGLRRGDEVFRVDGRPVPAADRDLAGWLLDGPEGTEVTLDVWPQGDRRREVRLVVPRRLVRSAT